PQFDSTQHSINQILVQLLPERTEDQTPEGFFTMTWNEHGMGRLKDHLRKHFFDSSAGEDGTPYADLREILDDELAALHNEYSYRLIALKSCFLKGLTILIHWRIRLRQED
ncbi:hypothetical protein B0H19DRAFT_965694, partial [Mycena capillaripes]